MRYNDEISDIGDIGHMICQLLVLGGYGVKNQLWDLFDDALSDDSFEGLKDILSDYWEERRGE